MFDRYDLCVIGSGPAGQRAAIQAAKLGKRACVVEKRPVLGGVTVNTGTIPSKALREAILAQQPGGRRDDLFARIKASARRVVDIEIATVGKHFAANGIDVIHGKAAFKGPREVEVLGPAGARLVAADRFLIAVGTRPARPASIPFDDSNVITSDEIVAMDQLPHSMIVVGGGVIGTEYASMMARLGVKVTLVEGRDRLVPFLDDEIIESLQYHLRKSGVTLRLSERVTAIRAEDVNGSARTVDNRLAVADLQSGKSIRADCLLYAIGRQGATDGLNLEAAGLSADDRGRITVDERYRTAAEHVYAAGDVIGFPALASTSMEQGRIAACHMFGHPATLVPEQLPFGIYAIPEISMVGLTERELTDKGVPFESGIAQYEEIARGQLLGDDTGMLKLLIHQETHQILGVHAIGTGATELIHIGQAAMAFGAPAEYFVQTVFNYPTLAECYKVAAYNGLNKLNCV